MIVYDSINTSTLKLRVACTFYEPLVNKCCQDNLLCFENQGFSLDLVWMMVDLLKDMLNVDKVELIKVATSGARDSMHKLQNNLLDIIPPTIAMNLEREKLAHFIRPVLLTMRNGFLINKKTEQMAKVPPIFKPYQQMVWFGWTLVLLACCGATILTTTGRNKFRFINCMDILYKLTLGKRSVDWWLGCVYCLTASLVTLGYKAVYFKQLSPSLYAMPPFDTIEAIGDAMRQGEYTFVSNVQSFRQEILQSNTTDGWKAIRSLKSTHPEQFHFLNSSQDAINYVKDVPGTVYPTAEPVAVYQYRLAFHYEDKQKHRYTVMQDRETQFLLLSFVVDKNSSLIDPISKASLIMTETGTIVRMARYYRIAGIKSIEEITDRSESVLGLHQIAYILQAYGIGIGLSMLYFCCEILYFRS